MRLNRLQHHAHARSLDRTQPAVNRAPRGRMNGESGFESAARRGPVLSPAQAQEVKFAVDAALEQFASQLLALANGKAPVAQPAVETPREEGTPGPGDPTPIDPSKGGQWLGFSPAPPPGVSDPRDHGPYTLGVKKADTYPKQLPDESLAQYALRTAAQTGFPVSSLGAFLGTITETGKSFPELVDRFQNPTAYWDQAEVDRQNMMREADLKAASRIYTGPVPFSSLTTDDKRYLYGMADKVTDVYELLSGPKVDISRLINDTAYNLGGSSGFDLHGYQGQMRPLVEKLLAERGLKHP